MQNKCIYFKVDFPPNLIELLMNYLMVNNSGTQKTHIVEVLKFIWLDFILNTLFFLMAFP